MKSQNPNQTLASNLRWTRSGLVWADFLLTGIPYGLRPVKEKRIARALHQALLRALPGESLLLGVCAQLDPAAIVERMLKGLDHTTHAEWIAECEATLDTLDRIRPGQRVYWLSVPLANPGHLTITTAVQSRVAEFTDWLALPRHRANPHEIERRLRQANQILDALPSAFAARPVTPAQMAWLHQHTLDRGMFRDQYLPGRRFDDISPTVMVKHEAALAEPVVDEGGQSDLTKTDLKRWNPASRRFLKITDPTTPGDLEQASYQAMLVMADAPDGGMAFPGSEIVGRIDESGLYVDWAMRLHVRSSRTVAAENRKALRNLNEQYQQRSGELSHAFNMLDRVSKDLAEYVATLESDKLEVEVQATVLYALSGDTPESANAQARAFASWMEGAGYKVSQPLGHQETMWWAMQPGIPTGSFVRQYAQVTTSRDLSALVPLASNHVGDTSGVPLGLNIANGPMMDTDLPCGPSSMILHDVEGGTKRHMSGSLAIAGELGAGKSYLLKGLGSAVLDRGGRVVIPDRTELAEYAKWATAKVKTVVVDVVDPQWSLDPLRLFNPADASRIAASFLIPLLGINPTSRLGTALADALDPDYLTAHHITGSGQLVDHLTSPDCTIEESDELGRMIRVYARKRYGAAVFDDTIPPLDIHTARAIVVNTHTLQLPSQEEIHNQHLFNQLIPEKLFGRAMFALIALIARQICFADDIFSVFLLDETHAVTASNEGEREIIDFLRDGRKHDAAVFLGSHDPDADFGSDVLRGLIPVRIQMRQRDETLARNGLRWLGLKPEDDPDVVELLTKQTSPITADDELPPMCRLGEFLIRDAAGNIGRGKYLGPQLAATRDAARTDRRALENGHHEDGHEDAA